jgi:hypothetical protein
MKVIDTTKEVIILKNRIARYHNVWAERKYRPENCISTVVPPPVHFAPQFVSTSQNSTILMEFIMNAIIKKYFSVFHFGCSEISPIRLSMHNGSNNRISNDIMI